MKFHFTCTSFGYASVTSTRWLILAILPFVAAIVGLSGLIPDLVKARE